MSEPHQDPRQHVVALLARLLDVLDALEFIGRHLHPPNIETVVATLGDRDRELRATRATLSDAAQEDHLTPLRDQLQSAVEYTLYACDGLRDAVISPEGVRQAYRAQRQASRALEALYPLTSVLPSVSRFFLEPKQRDDQKLLDRLHAGAARPDVRSGVMHTANDTNERAGFSLYVPEDYDRARAYPLVIALHGGSGHGRQFLWSWLRTARSRGVILGAPTAIGSTWSLMEPELDSANLVRVLEQIAQAWTIDGTRLLLTGMSDGGTFTLLSGLDEGSPFTHLAPVAGSFHPLLLTMAEPRRVSGLPVYLVHGALDWMFPVSVARTAHRALTAAGANVRYREIADLSHAYPRDENSAILDWFLDPRLAAETPRP
jgi:phospholipase/carboxylesterase